jgi:hypothetical protein
MKLILSISFLFSVIAAFFSWPIKGQPFSPRLHVVTKGFVLVILILLAASSAFCLTPKERVLVNGLGKINTGNELKLKENAATIAKQTADYLILWNTADSQSKTLENGKLLLQQQESELGTQQAKIHDQEVAMDKLAKDLKIALADVVKYKHEAHVKSVVIDVTLVGLAIAGTIVIMMCSGQIIGFIVKIWPPAAAFGLLLEIGIAVGSFAIIFGTCKGILAVIESHL